MELHQAADEMMKEILDKEEDGYLISTKSEMLERDRIFKLVSITSRIGCAVCCESREREREEASPESLSMSQRSLARECPMKT